MFKGIFWKVFLAIWLTNLLIGASSALYVSFYYERIERQNKVKQHADKIGAEIIEAYLLEQTIVQQQPFQVDNNLAFFIQILDDDTLIFGPPVLPDGTNFGWTTPNQGTHTYRFKVSIPSSHTVVPRFTASIQTVPALLGLFLVAIASWIFSRFMTSPLRKLRDFSRQLGHGKLNEKIEHELLERRDEIGELAQELDAMADNLRRQIENKQQLLHDVSHELRAPLTRLQVATELALGETSNSEYGDRIHHEVDQLEQLIKEILNFSRIDQHTSKLHNHKLIDLCSSAIDDCRFLAPNTPFAINIDETIAVLADEQLFARALGNLLNNAIKHTPPGTAIDLYAKTQGDAVQLLIRDHGPGLLEANLKQLFEPFTRFNHSSQGYGLGLAIAQRACEAQNGSLKARNHNDGGLEFTVTLPRAKS